MNVADGSVVVVTGGASGIGAACCALLAQRGGHVIVTDVAEDAGHAVAQRVSGSFIRLDVGDADAVEAAAGRIEDEFGPVAGLVNSASVIQPPLPPEDLSLDVWDRVVHIDQRGVYVACLAFGSRMATRRTGGAIVNIASVAGSRSLPLHSYSPAKAAVISMTACLAAAWGRSGVRVNAVSPGYTLTPALKAEIEAGRRDVSLLAGNAALDRLVAPEEVAEAVAFLLSPASSAISGIDLPVDCGWLAGSSWNTYGGLPAPLEGSA